MHMNFQNKTAWVTGAKQGIGKAVAEKLMHAGAQVVMLDVAYSTGISTFQSNECAGRHFEVGADIADYESVARITEQLLNDNLGPDVVINAAGVLKMGPVEDLSYSDWQRCFAVNVHGPFNLLSKLVAHFQQKKSGAIVNVASNAAHVPRKGMAAYAASKAALVSFSHCLGLELAPFQVRCNVVSPGSTLTTMFTGMFDSETENVDSAVARTIKGLPEQFKLGIPLGKIALPEDVANVALFLASDLANHITLQDVVVDGGATLAA